MKNHKLANSVSDQGWAELRRQLEYKSEIYGDTLVVVDRWYPSSKTCSNCGYVKNDLTLNDRIYHCDSCGFTMDRDLNAAMNLSQYPRREGNSRPRTETALVEVGTN